MSGDRPVGLFHEGGEPVAVLLEMLDSVSDAIVVVDGVTGERLYANRAVLEMLGVSSEELADVPVGSPSTFEEAADIHAAIAALVSGAAGDVTVDSHVRHRDGSLRAVEIRMTHHPGSNATNGHPYIVCMGIDVTDREHTLQQLRVREEALSAAFDRSPVGMSLVSVGHVGGRRILRTNAATAALLGTMTDSLVGGDLDDHLEPLGTEGQPDDRATSFGARRRVRRADGQVRWVEERTVELREVDVYRLDPVGDAAVGPGGRVELVEMVDVTEFELDARRQRRRAQVAGLVAAVAQAFLEGRPIDDAYQLVVDGIADVLPADHVALAVPSDTGTHVIVAASGPVADESPSSLPPLDPAVVARVATLDRAVPVTAPAIEALSGPGGAGPLAAMRFRSPANGDGVVTVLRRTGSPEFDDADLLTITELGQQLALAIALGIERVDAERLAVLEDRQRIADRLHDTVVQDLVASGMVLDAHLRDAPDPPAALRAVLDQLNETVQRLRSVVFDLATQRAIDHITEPERRRDDG